MLMRSFSRREKVMLVILALVLMVGLYVLLVQRPVEAKLDALALEKEDLELREQVAEIRLGQYSKMKKELDEIFAMPKDQLTVMPPYDNIETLMVQFDSIFLGLEPKLSFPPIKTEEGVATRPIQFEFEAPSYDQARAILTRLTRTGYRSLLDGLAIKPAEAIRTGRLGGEILAGGSIQQGPVLVQGTISFYELDPEATETTAAEEEAAMIKALQAAQEASDKEGDKE